MKKTKKAFEEHLNNLLEPEDLIYITNKTRGAYVSENKLYNSKNLGHLMRIYDPIAFQVGYNEWRP